jgi:hypothetical protein
MHLPIVILASSRKNSGICLAGKRLDGATRSWVRPVSTLAGQSWPRRGLQYVVGGVPRLADGHDGRSDALLCLSLAQPFNGYCYKLVAGVVEAGAEG